jgi:hypothetical protein
MLRGIADGVIVPRLTPDGHSLLGRVIKQVSLVEILVGTWTDPMVPIDVAEVPL